MREYAGRQGARLLTHFYVFNLVNSVTNVATNVIENGELLMVSSKMKNVEIATVKHAVKRIGEDEYWRWRQWRTGDDATVYMVVDPYPSTEAGTLAPMEMTLTSLLTDTNVRNFDENAGELFQFHAFSRQPRSVNNTTLEMLGGSEENVLSEFKDVLGNVAKVIFSTGALSRRYVIGETRIANLLKIIESENRASDVLWLVDPANGLPSSATYRGVRSEGYWLLEQDVDWHQLK